MNKDKREWTMRQKRDLESAKHEVSYLLDSLMAHAPITVLGVKSGRVSVEARWDEFDSHCLNISVDFPSWPADAAVDYARSQAGETKEKKRKCG